MNIKQELIRHIEGLTEDEAKILYIKLKHNITLDQSKLTEQEKEIIKQAEEEIKQGKINILDKEV